MGLVNAVLNLLFPSYCLVCGESGVDFCLKCLSASPAAERECAKWVHPLYDYRHPGIKKSVWLLKYKGKKPLASVFAEALYGRVLEEVADLYIMENFSSPLLIPVPLSPQRYRERGFNQASLVARHLASLDNNKNFTLEENILVKPRDTKHQARVESRAERLRNLEGSFKVANPDLVRGKNIILIDDVVTTGATLTEARKTLKEAGARHVIAFTVAH